MDLSRETFQNWVQSYGEAWEGRDAKAASALFSYDALYYWTPFDEPKRGREGIAAAWQEATSRQRNVTFSYEVLAVTGGTRIARWHTSLERSATARRVELDGILAAEFDSDSACCRRFREWWHSTEER
jgi:ketosteroid isomerase-like protein